MTDSKAVKMTMAVEQWRLDARNLADQVRRHIRGLENTLPKLRELAREIEAAARPGQDGDR